MDDRKPWHNRAVGITEELCSGTELRKEEPIPQQQRSIDAWASIEEGSALWGPLREHVSGRQVLFEFYSQPPSAADLVVVLYKWTWKVLGWSEEQLTQRQRAPAVVVISVGAPLNALEEFEAFSLWEGIEGLYHMPLARGGDWWLIDVTRLERLEGLTFLRLYDHREQVEEENLEGFERDDSFNPEVRRDVMNQLEEQKIISSAQPEKPMLRGDRFYAAYTEGLQTGLEQAREETEQAREETEQAREETEQAREELERVVLAQRRVVLSVLCSKFAEVEEELRPSIEALGVEQLEQLVSVILEAHDVETLRDWLASQAG